MSKIVRLSLASVFAAAVLGCGGAPRPEARLASSEGAIRGAKEAGAEDVPNGALHVKLAEEQRQQALDLIKKGDNHRAAMLLARAESDAELALALARASTAKVEADKASESVDELKQRGAQ
jgi:hypothetical protein